jgi:hypothetical protein
MAALLGPHGERSVGPSPLLRLWHGLQDNQQQNSLRPQSPRQKSFMELSCLRRASVARGCWPRRKLCLPRIWRVASSGSRVTQREFFLRLLLTAVRSADLSATRMRRSRPLPKCEGRSSQRAMVQISRTVVLMCLIPGMVLELVIRRSQSFAQGVSPNSVRAWRFWLSIFVFSSSTVCARATIPIFHLYSAFA